MSRKHLIVLAQSVAVVNDRNERIQLCLKLGTICQEANPKFDWKKWNKACNV